MASLRSKVIRLAHAHPELRPHILPLLKEAAVKMQGKDHHVKAANLVLTFTYNPELGITVTAKNDQVNPKAVPDYLKDQIAAAGKKWRMFSNAVKSGNIPRGTPPGAVAQVGWWTEQASYSDNSGYAVTATNPVFGQYIADFLPKFFPIGGGGVPGSYGYKGSGWTGTGSSNEWVWHNYSFGIGD